MTTTIQKWGNSLGLRIPRPMTREIGLEDGAEVDIQMDHGSIVIRPAKKKHTLRDLLAGVTPANRHPETDWGAPEGKEAW